MLMNRMTNEFAPLMQLQGQMNRLFESFSEDLPTARPYATAYPALNTWEDGDNAYVEAELPGMSMDDLEIYVAGSELRIAGERKIAEPQGASWHRRERTQGRFTRTLTLPWEIDADKVEATLKDGVLTIKLPKCESCKPRKVKVLTA
jgi:HSP20 family protein